MRDVKRNKQKIWYALRTGSVENIDEYGNVTGTFTETYSEPVLLKINVSAPKGTIDLERFGLESKYTAVLTTTDLHCPIAMDSVLWIGTSPFNDEGEQVNPYNHVVVRISPTINQLVIMVKQVDVSDD